MRVVVTIITLYIIQLLSTTFSQDLPFNPYEINHGLLNNVILEELNARRAEQGLDPLEKDTDLGNAAHNQSDYMARRQEVTHSQKGANNATPVARLAKDGKVYSSVGETILGFNYEGNYKIKGSKPDGPLKTYQRLALYLLNEWSKDDASKDILYNPDFAVSYAVLVPSEFDATSYVTMLFASESYKVPSKAPEQPALEMYSAKNCKSCNDSTLLGFSLASGIHVVNDSIFFFSDSKKIINKLLGSATSGMAADIVVLSQFECGGRNLLNASAAASGFLLKPVYDFDNQPASVYEDNFVKIFLGIVPRWIDEPYEVNLSLIVNNKPCSNRIQEKLSTGSLEPIEIPFMMDTIPPNWYKNTKDTMRFKVFFEQGETNIENEDVLAAKELLAKEADYIISANITAKSSIEGSSKTNITLQEKRAQALLNVFYKFLTDSMEVNLKTEENFGDFRAAIKGTSFESLGDLENGELKKKINEDKELRTKLEPILSQQRYAELTFIVHKKDTVKHDPSTILKEYQDLLDAKNFGGAARIQTVVLKFLKEGKLTMSEVNGMNIPDDPAFATLSNNAAIITYLLDSENPDRANDLLQKLTRIQSYAPKNVPTNTNLMLLQIDKYFYDVASGAIEEEEKVTIDKKLEEFGRVDKKTKYRVMVNYYMLEILLSFQNQTTESNAKWLTKIKEIYKKAKYSNEELFQFAETFMLLGDFETSYKIFKKLIKLPNPKMEYAFGYLRCIELGNIEFKARKKEDFLRTIAQKNPEGFCTVMLGDRFSFQRLSDPLIKEVYCETCAEQVEEEEQEVE